MRINLAVGARIITGTPFQSRLRGTDKLLTAAGRAQLTQHYRDAFVSAGAGAVCTALDTSQAHLEATRLCSDSSLDNDLAYYVVGKGNGAGGYEQQSPREPRLGGLASGFHCIPREMVSIGEVRTFAGLLAELAVECASAGRDGANASDGLVGATIRFEAGFVGGATEAHDAHLGTKMGYQMQRASRADFFLVAGCASAEHVALVGRELEANRRSVERRYRADKRGMMALEDEPSEAGFDVPALLLTSALPGTDEFDAVLMAAADEPRVAGLAAPRALDDAQLERCIAVQPEREGFVLAGPSDAEGELAVLRA